MTRATICILERRANERPGDLRVAHRHEDGRWRELARGLPMLSPRSTDPDAPRRRWQTVYFCRECGFVAVSLVPT